MTLPRVIGTILVVLGFVFIFSAYRMYTADSTWALPFALMGGWMIWSGGRALRPGK